MAQHLYNPATGGYNITPSVMHSLRAKLALSAAGVSDTHIVFLTDSTFGGYGGVSYAYDTNPAREMARQLATSMGVTWQQGIQMAIGDKTHLADNWAKTGASALASVFLETTGVATLTRTPLPGETGANIDIFYSGLQTAGINWKLNTVSQTALPASGTNIIQKNSLTGQAVNAKTIEIDGLSAHTGIFVATRVWDPSVKSLHIHNLSIGGSAACNTVGTVPNDLNWSSTSNSGTYGLGWIMPNLLTAAGITPDFLVVSIGGNDLNLTNTVAGTLTGLDGMFGLYPTTPGMIINAHKVSTVADALQNQLSAGKFDHADSLNKAMFNWDDYFGGNAAAIADGLVGTVAGSDGDSTHPKIVMQKLVGKQIAKLIAA